ncbi:phosphoribosylaminoimidazole carboxylase, chloroplastic isoform X4 [Setaria viridis]|uniref:phosphoribosylaminoimidazole carboxylase, chloroplastic isoform X4 n=1 Tax=Setaria viridis TaxID=4556 RepID=UPI003B3ACC38
MTTSPQAASQMGIMIVILDPLQDCPASSVCHEHVVGSFNDGDTVREFAKRCGVLIVEIEHVDAVTLEKLEKQGVDCEPKASTIMIIQDRYRQKNHFSKFGIPLPDFMEVDTLHSIEEAGERFGYPLMVKSKRLAYDGRGNAVAQNKEELSSVVALFRVPIKTQSLLGLDSLLSIVQMPKGIPVATVAIGSAENAGLLAVRMLASRDPELYALPLDFSPGSQVRNHHAYYHLLHLCPHAVQPTH